MEDDSNCPKGKFLHFKTVNPKYRFEEVVESVDLYVYRQDGSLTGKYHYSKESLEASGFEAYLPQQPVGDYTVVALVNRNEANYNVSQDSNMKGMSTNIITVPNDTVNVRPADLYHACKPISFVTSSQQKDTMFLVKNTNNVTVTLEFAGWGKDAPPPSDVKYGVFLTGSNGTYNYENRPSGNTRITYMPYKQEESSVVCEYRMTTMRLWRNSDLMVYVVEKRPGKPPVKRIGLVLTDELAKIIDSNGIKRYDTDEKLALEDEFYLKFMFDGPLLVGFELNGWFLIKPDVSL
jgi:hypothetical protein